jgi:hypothetical protein
VEANMSHFFDKMIDYLFRLLNAIKRILVHLLKSIPSFVMIIAFYFIIFLVGIIFSWYFDLKSYFESTRNLLFSASITIFVIDFLRTERDRHNHLISLYRFYQDYLFRVRPGLLDKLAYIFDIEASSLYFLKYSKSKIKAPISELFDIVFSDIHKTIEKRVTESNFWTEKINRVPIDHSHLVETRGDLLNYAIGNFTNSTKDLCLFNRLSIDNKTINEVYAIISDVEINSFLNGNSFWVNCDAEKVNFSICNLIMASAKIEYLLGNIWRSRNFDL